MCRLLSARKAGVTGCHFCHLVFQPATDSMQSCPRCHTRQRLPDRKSLGRSWALLIAAVIVYVPANVLPVMFTSLFGRGKESTIMEGVVDFWHAGSYGIAVIIFIASVVIPCMKFLSMAVLLISSAIRSQWAQSERTRLYHITEWIGCWSMLDVIVVAVVSGLIQFHSLGEAEPRAGILFFGLVVFLTMLSALSFDPRLIWAGDK
ncbi:paraquat-inducible protein A [Pectobacterium actinidiae]|uniref:Paraquat-inducible protein A n=1 Tax=Pectobacterium actinidiae TaxID=1507808 RepID=A0A1V2QYG9_9GAMM|nr:paraquat-inducible protein A [Pectobacterium actinidiae]ONK01071.1 paraquat-inducible protein A [Pectobacterium actinidiae]ONK01267.1 paraquat-inducible protein A [Pectobacterium actinidiae]